MHTNFIENRKNLHDIVQNVCICIHMYDKFIKIFTESNFFLNVSSVHKQKTDISVVHIIL